MLMRDDVLLRTVHAWLCSDFACVYNSQSRSIEEMVPFMWYYSMTSSSLQE